ncbi:cytochrome-c peroxidase [Pseudorhodoferax sp.]|uniref:cytochrome-c peroxidase n=1 Tax=Pseudorhodoferax sp. TaxID=1993553 RepID=UPI002DD6348E|nr:cytochrome c peroxidase [Pseudorhodoferax sp.]
MIRLLLAAAAAAALTLACGGGGDSGAPGTSDGTADAPVATCRAKASPDEQLACFTALYGVTPLEAPPVVPDARFAVGVNLFTSTKLSGTGKVACVSCHANNNAGVQSLVTMDGRTLARALHPSLRGGDADDPANATSIHRNAPDLVNKLLGSPQFIFHDGRVAADGKGGFVTPMGDKLPAGLENLLAAQALVPLLTRDEMLGYAPGSNGGRSENPMAGLVSDPVEANPQPVWNAVMQRVLADPVLASGLAAAFPEVAPGNLGIQHVANALASFQTRRWNAGGSVYGFHGWLRDRERWPLPADAMRGALAFFDKGRCAQCHSGPKLTDSKFHNLAVPQIGPGFGSGAGETPRSDKGRYEVTRQDADLYAFLTPSLWEVRATAPYFHNGVYDGLEKVIRHHIDAAGHAQAFRCASDAPLLQTGVRVECRDSQNAPALHDAMVNRLAPQLKTVPVLSEAEIADLIAFLKTVTNGNNGGG